MHSDRIGLPDRRALSSLSDRVIGLGAPVSVLIRPDPCEEPLLRAELSDRIAQHEAERPQVGDEPEGADLDTLQDWEAEHRAWQAMLDGVRAPDRLDVELLWPSPYAAPVLRGVAAAAAATYDKAPSDVGAARALESARATLRAFLAVDNGGLEEVSL
jgi:hypothetical protein